MLIGVGGLELEVRPGVTAAEIVAFARSHGVSLPRQPWCGAVQLQPNHPAGLSPLVAFSCLTSHRGPDARPLPGVHLAVVGGQDAGLVATLTEGLTVGRSAEAGLRLTDPTVSAVHARFRDGRVVALPTRNGSTLRGKRVRWRPRIRTGDVLTFGDTTVVVAGMIGDDSPETRSRPWGLASSAMAAASMGVFAIATGHWQLAILALVVPAIAAAGYVLRRPRPSVGPVLDVTGTLDLAPLPPGPLAVRGPRELVRAVTLATGRPRPGAPHREPWMGRLPAAGSDVTWVREGDSVPSWTEVIVTATGASVTVEGHGASVRGPLPLVSEQNADAASRRIAGRLASAALPDDVSWGDLPPPPNAGLGVRLGMGPAGPVVLDLVADGPHILVAGTTGSGKSEALRTIVCSLAHDFAPGDVTFALIDFKGGAGLRECQSLPHVGSVLTDLEPHLARRCLLALSAELTDRKRAAARAGATGFDDWHHERPPRLVVVVDEFQEIAAADRDFLPELARLAAQGRSLGIHLVLATQRPAGAVGAQIRANIGATLALRTASEAESRDLLGTAAAAQLPIASPGRAVLLRGTTLTEVQVARPFAVATAPIRVAHEAHRTGPSLADAARAQHSGHAKPLWLPELPERIAPQSDGPTHGPFSLGVCDAPTTRSRDELTWDPSTGPLVVCGPPRSGRTSVVHAVGAMARERGLRPVVVPADPRLAIRTLALTPTVPNAVLLVDDCAATLASANTADPEAMDVLAEALVRVPTILVVPPAWATHRLTSHAGLRLVLTGLQAQDDAAWTVPAELRGLQALAGRCRAADSNGWREAQLALPAPFETIPLARSLPRELAEPLTEHAIGIGTDDAVPVFVPREQCAVVGPPGPERDSIARRLAIASGHEPIVTDNAFALGMPGSPSPRTVVIVRATARSLREVMREHPRGLIEPSPIAYRVVVVIDGVASAVQVLPG
jgi:S-DNA-T family DNA segregation ATPase FtsK/SpoIIIE